MLRFSFLLLASLLATSLVAEDLQTRITIDGSADLTKLDVSRATEIVIENVEHECVIGTLLVKAKALERLEVHNSRIGALDLAVLPNLTSLHEIVFVKVRGLSSPGVSHLPDCPNLSALSFLDCSLGQGTIRETCRIAGLKALRLHASNDPEENALLSLEKLSMLEELRLQVGYHIDVQLASVIASLVNVRHLFLSGSKVAEGTVLSKILSLKLETFDLSNVSGPYEDGLVQLAACSSLRTLRLSGLALPKGSISRLCRELSLVELDLSQCDGVDDAVIGQLECMKESLEVLLLGATDITDASLATLKQCASLRVLSISQCNAVDNLLVAMASLVDCSALHVLDVSGLIKFDGQALQILCESESLRIITVQSSGLLPMERIQDFRNRHPRITFVN